MPPAAHRLVASVYPDVAPVHLDRLFDYAVPADLAEQIAPGSRVRVRFAGKLVDAYVMTVGSVSQHDGKLASIERVIGNLPVLTDETGALIRAVADRWAGTFCDVARLAVPARNAKAEQTEPAQCVDYPPPSDEGWSHYPPGFLDALTSGRRARAVWNALPGERWPQRFAEAAAATAAGGRSAVLIVPDVKDVARVADALSEQVGGKGFVELHAALGPAARYRRFVACLRSEVRIVVGTRSAVFAPLRDLGLIAVWDDGDDLYDEPRSPYAHTRDIAVLRAHLSGANALIGGFSQSVAATALLERRWAQPLRPTRDELRARMPRILASGDDVFLRSDAATHSARMPKVAIDAARQAVGNDQPVLVQVPRRGYLPSLGCVQCGTPARCGACQGPLAIGAKGADLASCRWCGVVAVGWQCALCHATRFRAAVVGASRTAEEIARMVPDVPVVQSAGERVVAQIEPGARIVIATPGAEPVVDGGYGAVLLLDGWALLTRSELLASEEALRRWMNAAGLARSAADGGRVVVMAPAAIATIQALVRFDAAWFAERELAERTALAFPPAVRMAAVVGDAAAISAIASVDGMPSSVDTLGPVSDFQDPSAERLLLRVPLSDGDALARALHQVRSARSMRKASDRLHIRLDPQRLL